MVSRFASFSPNSPVASPAFKMAVEKKLEFVQSVLEARKSWTQGDDKKAEQFVQHASSIEQDHSKTLDRVLNEMARNERMGHK